MNTCGHGEARRSRKDIIGILLLAGLILLSTQAKAQQPEFVLKGTAQPNGIPLVATLQVERPDADKLSAMLGSCLAAK